MRSVLSDLRLWGCCFSEDGWRTIYCPYRPDQRETGFDDFSLGAARVKDPEFARPGLESSRTHCSPRPGEFLLDVAEVLARVSRTRVKPTQAGRPHLREIRNWIPSLLIPSEAYAVFLYNFLGDLGVISPTEDSIELEDQAVDLLRLPANDAVEILSITWASLRELADIDPAATASDAEHTGAAVLVRDTLLEVPIPREPEAAVSVGSLVRLIDWMRPNLSMLALGERGLREAVLAVLRSGYWLGVFNLDNPELPTAVCRSTWAPALGRETPPPTRAAFSRKEVVVQPNGQVFCPPNLHPEVYLHVRRLTDEQKKTARGMHPLTPASILRALSAQTTPEEILKFLEDHSKHPIPGTVQNMVRTAARQHGRVRLVPAGMVLVTQDEALHQEVRSIPSVSRALGRQITERVSVVPQTLVSDAVKALRQRGYAPLLESELLQRIPPPGVDVNDPGPQDGDVRPIERIRRLGETNLGVRVPISEVIYGLPALQDSLSHDGDPDSPMRPGSPDLLRGTPVGAASGAARADARALFEADDDDDNYDDEDLDFLEELGLLSEEEREDLARARRARLAMLIQTYIEGGQRVDLVLELPDGSLLKLQDVRFLACDSSDVGIRVTSESTPRVISLDSIIEVAAREQPK